MDLSDAFLREAVLTVLANGFLLNEPRRKQCADDAVEDDSGEHHQAGYHASHRGDRRIVAVSDGCHGHPQAPQGLGVCADRGAGSVAFGIQQRERAHEKHHDGHRHGVGDDARAEALRICPAQRTQRREREDDSQRTEHRQRHHQQVKQVGDEPSAFVRHQDKRDDVIDGENDPQGIHHHAGDGRSKPIRLRQHHPRVDGEEYERQCRHERLRRFFPLLEGHATNLSRWMAFRRLPTPFHVFFSHRHHNCYQ